MNIHRDENADLFASFLKWLRAGHAPATVESYHAALSILEKYLNERGLRLESCAADDLLEYSIWLENRGLRCGTRALYVTALKTVWRWLHRQGRVPFSPEMIPTPQRYETKSYPMLEADEYARLMGVFSEHYPRELRDKAIVSLLYDTSLRLGEMVALDLSALDIAGMKARVRTFKRQNHWREVYWGGETGRLLGRWLEFRRDFLAGEGLSSPALFIAVERRSAGERISSGSVQRMFRAARLQAGIFKQVTPHSMRHTGITENIRGGMPIATVSRNAGHARLNTTGIYVHMNDRETEEAWRRARGSALPHPTTFGSMAGYGQPRENPPQYRDVPALERGQGGAQYGQNRGEVRHYQANGAEDNFQNEAAAPFAVELPTDEVLTATTFGDTMLADKDVDSFPAEKVRQVNALKIAQ